MCTLLKQQSRDIQFMFIYDEEKQHIVTLEKLETDC